MSMRTRAWLRGFLHLGARADKDGIPPRDIERQEDTVLRALDILDTRPGVVLADEVGMGKTYEALGVAAAMRCAKPRNRIVIITPGPDLNRKWSEEFPRFREMFDFGEDIFPVRNLAEFVQAVRSRHRHPIVVAPVNMFQSGRGYSDQVYLLSLYFYWKRLHGNTANAILRRFREGEHERVDVEAESFLGVFDLQQIERHLRAAFQRSRGSGPVGLDDLYECGGVPAFDNENAVRDALYRARFVLAGKLMPMIDLLIVDEAHKLRNPGSLRTQAMRRVFKGRFRKALFLTATPFQLDVGELRQVFFLFAHAKDAPGDLKDQVQALLTSVREYQSLYEAFQQTWASLDPEVATEFRLLYDRDSSALDGREDPVLKVLAEQVAALKTLKTETIEPGFQQWMIRSLREDKRSYRNPLPKDIRAAGADMLPFLIYERFIAELFRRGRQTHKVAVEINMVSSYAAAKGGAILSTADGIPEAAEVYRDLLREILGEIESGADHPKISKVIKDALDAAEQGEKTLIFCARTATLAQLRRELEAIWESRVLERWRRVYPDARPDDIFGSRDDDAKGQHGRHRLLQERLHRPQDSLYLALREPYLRTLAPLADWSLHRLPDIAKEANRILKSTKVGKTAAERLDYQLAERCTEQAAVRLWRSSDASGHDEWDAVRPLLHAAYVRHGIDLARDDLESDSIGDERPRWEISEHVARMVLGRGGSLWEGQSDLLDALDPKLRVRVVEQLARYLTYKQVTFLPDLLSEANAAGLSIDPVRSRALLQYMPRFWQADTGRRWVRQIRTFLSYFCQRNQDQQREILDGPIRTGDFARHTRDGESRERLREAFNTPLYPMVLIANEVMQEGLDLQKHCRRVVHHDLVWNPAQLEQRVGRIDRLGSLTNRLRQNGADVTLDILYPVICGTIDKRLFRTVKTREKWLEFLLGAAPDFSEYSFTDEEPVPLPDGLGADLAINLGPR